MTGEMLAQIYWMDGYGPYVWTAWVIAGLALKGLLLFLKIQNDRVRKQLERLSAGRPADSVPR